MNLRAIEHSHLYKGVQLDTDKTGIDLINYYINITLEEQYLVVKKELERRGIGFKNTKLSHMPQRLFITDTLRINYCSSQCKNCMASNCDISNYKPIRLIK